MIAISLWVVIPVSLVMMFAAYVVIMSVLDEIRYRKKIANGGATTPEFDWRAERRDRMRSELNDWDREYRALLPPEPPCISTEHDHAKIMSWGGVTVSRICVK